MNLMKPIFLCILDGWGWREEVTNNAIIQGNTPNWDSITRDCPMSLLQTSGLAVGLPEGQMGNSEVGHMNIGSGRIVMQDLPKIDQAILSKEIDNNKLLKEYIKKLQESGKRCHLFGLLSDGGVHSHQNHILYLAKLIAGCGVEVNIHAFLDGRDTAQKSALTYLDKAALELEGHDDISVATISGRYFAMDRDNRWERVKEAYDTVIGVGGKEIASISEYILDCYDNDITDEFIKPAFISGYKPIEDGDGFLMVNFRADRVRQIIPAFLDPDFRGFERGRVVKFGVQLGMVEYSQDISNYLPALFPKESLEGILGEVVSKAGKKQLRVSETEKYAHVTFFLNGGREQEFAGEDRVLIPSPSVATYDQKPDMSAKEVMSSIIDSIKNKSYDLIIANFANPDMVGHTGIWEAALKAVETIDNMIGEVANAIKEVGGLMLITADHGNIENMFDAANNQPDTAHTLNPVPFVVVGSKEDLNGIALRDGRLCDIAPTILELMNLDQPQQMTGKSLIV